MLRTFLFLAQKRKCVGNLILLGVPFSYGLIQTCATMKSSFSSFTMEDKYIFFFFGKIPMSGLCPKNFSTLRLKLSKIYTNFCFHQIMPMPPFSHSAMIRESEASQRPVVCVSVRSQQHTVLHRPRPRSSSLRRRRPSKAPVLLSPIVLHPSSYSKYSPIGP